MFNRITAAFNRITAGINRITAGINRVTAVSESSGLQRTAAVWLSFMQDDSRSATWAEGFEPTQVALSHPELARGFTPTLPKLRGRRDLRTRVGRALFSVSTSIRSNLLKTNMEDLTNEQ